MEHDWSNPETKAIAYHLFDFEGDALEKFEDMESFLAFLSNEDRETFVREIESLISAGMIPEFDPDMDFWEKIESVSPGARVKYAAGRLRESFETVGNLGSIPILWEAGILIGASLKYKEGETGAPTKEDDPEWEEALSNRDLGIFIDMFLLALDKVDWEEIVTVWIENRAEEEDDSAESESPE